MRPDAEKERLELLAALQKRALGAMTDWTPRQCRVRGAAFCALTVVMLVLHPLFWRGTQAEWWTTFWPLAIVMLWDWALASWLALSFYKYN